MTTSIVRKDALASIQPGEDDAESSTGSFHIILSAPTKDRDGETLLPDEWEQPLPDHITMDRDHGMTVATTVGSGVPTIEDDGTLHVRGTYSSLPMAQGVRTLVNEGHIRTTSVAFLRKSATDAKGVTNVRRELLNGAFVAIPSNTNAVVLSSKALKEGRRNSNGDAAMIQAIHDHAAELGAQCPATKTASKDAAAPAADTSEADQPDQDTTAGTDAAAEAAPADPAADDPPGLADQVSAVRTRALAALTAAYATPESR